MGKPNERPRRVVLDASALIGLIDGDADFAVLKSLLSALDDGEAMLVESTAIFGEVLPEHGKDITPAARAEIIALLRGPDVQIVDVGLTVATKASQLRVRFGLKTWDAIHLATAIVSGADIFIGRDHKFPAGQVVEGVEVRKPFDIFEDRLPFEQP